MRPIEGLDARVQMAVTAVDSNVHKDFFDRLPFALK
jgi:hypothetical protein